MMCPSVMFLAKVPHIPLCHPMYRNNFHFETFWQSWLPRLFQIILEIFFSKIILLTWAACITSHCIWWHLQSKTLTFRQLENSPFGIWTFTTISKTSFVVSNSFLRYIYIYHFDNRPFENVLIYCNLHNYIRDMSQHLDQSNHRSVWTLRGVSKALQRWNLMTRSRGNFQRNFFAITLEISPMQ